MKNNTSKTCSVDRVRRPLGGEESRKSVYLLYIYFKNSSRLIPFQKTKRTCQSGFNKVI
jgi:hypothetical protein